MLSAATDSFRQRRPRAFEPVSLGFRTVALVDPDDLAEAQVGYAVDPAGRALTGQKEGDWSHDWLVVATEDEVGDPLFVDASKPDWPVSTAMHGEGAWSPEQVADSFTSFLAALDLVRKLAQDRETPVALERYPISPVERENVLDEIATKNPQASLTFWETWLEEV